MKKWCVILAITLSAVLCACQRKTIQESRAESMEEAMEKSMEESNGSGITFSEAPEQDAPIPYGETVTFSGYQLQDGASVAVTVSMKIGDVLRGEEAYAVLLESDPQLSPPDEGKEYIVITVQVSYEEGEAKELQMYENIVSLPSANRYFAMSGSYGNAGNLTAALTDSIYNCTIRAGESAEGKAAFLHGVGENEPLVFAGFEQVLRFSLAS